MPKKLSNPLVSTEWLAAHLSAPDIRIVDASWHLPAEGRNARAEYNEAHIPEAVFFDIDEICNLSSPFPHMLPPPEKFSSRMRNLGLGDGHKIVVYDTGGLHAAARVWWMFRAFGHEDVVVLDGGLHKWRMEGRPLDDIPPIPRQRHFTARVNQFLIRTLDQIKNNLAEKREQVVDARSEARFTGEAPEPRPGVRSGHIPQSLNLPYAKLYNAADDTLRPADELKKLFEAANIDLTRGVVTSCGSGVTAGSLTLALYVLGHQDVAVYDGSWSEWGALTDTPVATGA
jgi:thiosulfate/3-mercaptopyruvate sulfurtransferase